jgi:type I restriction enzyme R subunit
VNTGNGDPKLAAEQRARVLIDRQLADAGWSVQDKKDLNLFATMASPAVRSS